MMTFIRFGKFLFVLITLLFLFDARAFLLHDMNKINLINCNDYHGRLRKERIILQVSGMRNSESKVADTKLPSMNHEEKNKDLRNDFAIESSDSLSSKSSSSSSSSSFVTSRNRQIFVLRKYPLYVSVRNSPSLKWLSQIRNVPNSKENEKSLRNNQFLSDNAVSQVYINGTILDKSVSYVSKLSRGWYSKEEDKKYREFPIQDRLEETQSYKMELIAEINVEKPGYLHLLPDTSFNQYFQNLNKNKIRLHHLISRLEGGNLAELHDKKEKNHLLWITGFSLTKRWGGITSMCLKTAKMKRIGVKKKFLGLHESLLDAVMGNNDYGSQISFGWPNEVNSVPTQYYSNPDPATTKHQNTKPTENEDALLVTDGFLVPGRENGGLYIIKNPGDEQLEWKVCLAGGDGEWFYHRAIWIDLTGDGRKSILTARAKRPSLLNSQQKPSQEHDSYTNSASKKNGQLVWLERPKPFRFDQETGTPLDIDGTVFDPFSARHVPWKVRVLDDGPDVMFSVADLDTTDDTIEIIASQFFGKCLSLHSIKIAPKPFVQFRRIINNDSGALFSSVLADFHVKEHNSSFSSVIDCGSTVPTLKQGDSFSHILVTSHESKSNRNKGNDDDERIYGGSLFAFRVPKKWKTQTWHREIIATGFQVNGQLSNMINPGAPGFCYTFYPKQSNDSNDEKKKKKQLPLIAVSGDCAEAAYIYRPNKSSSSADEKSISSIYSLLCEIDVGATVGSLAIGYGDFCNIQGQREGTAKIYVPAFEKNKILVFALNEA